MERNDKEFCLEVKGDYACFTRPEMKVERVSYDVITPSAARAIFDAILWKPAIRWEVTRIEVLNPIKWDNIRRNEVGAVANGSTKYISAVDNRQQRNTLLLRDVCYRIYAKMIYIPPCNRKSKDMHRQAGEDENPMKYHEMFLRRAKLGQCFNQPYLGNREFSADFRLVEENEILSEPIQETRDLGIMLYDMDYSESPKKYTPIFFRASMEKGIINVPSLGSKELLR